jgi:hypothetical protein
VKENEYKCKIELAKNGVDLSIQIFRVKEGEDMFALEFIRKAGSMPEFFETYKEIEK